MPRILLLAAAVFVPLASLAQSSHVYLGDLTSTTALIAWGKTTGSGNTIGRESKSLGEAMVQIGGKEHRITDHNWILVEGLQPNTDYIYQVSVAGKPFGMGSLRTYPSSDTKLTFMALGDYGNGNSSQQKLAAVMRREFLRRAATDDPIRFVATLGDNIYGSGVAPLMFGSGNQDKHWQKKFFQPYADLLKAVPFHPSLGNHDGDQTEIAGDLPVYLDNFFFPGNKPQRYYQFSYAGLADFFVLDSTTNKFTGVEPPGFDEASEQTKWLQSALASSRARWKIVYFHHPPITAGPEHPPMANVLRHWMELFQQTGVNLVLNGHEHNMQVASKTKTTGDVQYMVAGSGGQFRDGYSILRAKSENIAAFAEQYLFLVISINQDRMEITPYSTETVRLRDINGAPVPIPLVLHAR